MLARMLVEKIENRILVGVTMFVGIMLVIGWAAINENARMASFTRQYEARSAERGAMLFAANCATCHGTDGRGILARAPGLNSPHFFGYDYFAENARQINALQAEQSVLNQERTDLATEITNAATTAERAAEIDVRLTEIGERLNGEAGITAELAPLIEERDALVIQLQTAVDNGYPLEIVNGDNGSVLDYEPSRLGQVEWAGTRESYIVTTLIHGRPTSIGYWPAAMVSWSKQTGGSLRDDELDDLASFIQNWDKGADWTIEDALAVNQYGIIPGLPGAGGEAGTPIGVDAATIVPQLASVVGDPVRGDAIYNGRDRTGMLQRLGCAGCHANEAVAPLTEQKWDTAINVRLQLPQFAGYTVEQYLTESIVNPGAYTVPPYASGAMPANYGEQLTIQDMADILAYIHTFSTVDPYVAPPPGAEATGEAPMGEATAEATAAAGAMEMTPEATAEATAAAGS